MSVPPGERSKSGMDFVEIADNIEEKTMRLCRKWPKSWFFIITQRTVELASSVYEHAQIANSIIPKTEDERTMRVMELEQALGNLYAFSRKIERAYSLFPLCGEKKNASEKELEEKSNRILQEFMLLCVDEEDSLKGNMHYTRNLKIKSKQPQS